jgi:Cyclin, N-terminal domain
MLQEPPEREKDDPLLLFVPGSNAPTPKRVNSTTAPPSAWHPPSQHRTAAPNVSSSSSNKRWYRVSLQDGTKWVTRDMASLDFLLHIPFAAEPSIVQAGYQLQLLRDQDEHRAQGTWWDQWIAAQQPPAVRTAPSDAFLEQPPDVRPAGRRLEGEVAVRIQIPLTHPPGVRLTKQTSIARQAALREWEVATAWGTSQQPPLLDGRLFWSANSSYPIAVSSVLRYEPSTCGNFYTCSMIQFFYRTPSSIIPCSHLSPSPTEKEEAAFRRRKLEAIGGGGSQFVLPDRDWRGISYRALLRRGEANPTKQFNRFVRAPDDASDTSSSSSSSSSQDSNHYVPGLLDDPGMVLGRHRTVMIGDRVTGPMVFSTIQFVKPAVLKAELNKQFRERFDGWEPPKKARKYIGAQVIQGNYVLIDPTAVDDYADVEPHSSPYDPSAAPSTRRRQSSVASTSSNEATAVPVEKTIRMPPSLTLSKIRSIKSQALKAAVKANLEIGTVALACVYFERLCLEGRVDKSNRRISFAACWLLAAKINEPNVVALVTSKHDDQRRPQKSLLRPGHRSHSMFASLLLFFTQDWALSLQHVFTAEWCVFAALRFSLDATPSQVAFHFKRLLKTLEWNAAAYLGATMYQQWQDVLAQEEEERRRPRHADRLPTVELSRRHHSSTVHHDDEASPERRMDLPDVSAPLTHDARPITPPRRRKLWFTGARSMSTEHLAVAADEEEGGGGTTGQLLLKKKRLGGLLHLSPSLPDIASSLSIAAGDEVPMPGPPGEPYDDGNEEEEDGIVV